MTSVVSTPAGVEPAGPFTAALWSSVEGTYRRILEHPFLRELADGTLDREVFGYYVVQDSLYLRDYARALRLLAARAPTDRAATMFGVHAAGASAAEQAMHADFLRDLVPGGGGTGAMAGAQASPTTVGYTSYLLATAHSGTFPEALGAVLPCYWIYWRVGCALLERSSPDPLYARWIAAYGGEDFGAVTTEVLALTEEVGATLPPGDAERVRQRFGTAARYEWMFWDAAHRREGWPV